MILLAWYFLLTTMTYGHWGGYVAGNITGEQSVVVGPFSSQSECERIRAEIKSLHTTGCWQ